MDGRGFGGAGRGAKSLAAGAAGVAFMALTAMGGVAHADMGDGWGVGVGTGFGVHSSATPSNPGDSGVVADLNVRGRFLWMLGLDLRFNLQDQAAVELDDRAQFTAKYRTSLLLYVLPTPVVSLYLAGGIGATEGGDLLNPDAEGASYQAGLGLEWYVGPRFAIDASFLMIVPGWRSVERDVERRVDLEVAAYQANPAGGPPEVPDSLPTGDYVSPENFELMLRAMLVF